MGAAEVYFTNVQLVSIKILLLLDLKIHLYVINFNMFLKFTYFDFKAMPEDHTLVSPNVR
jgi:hypothetical protein